MTDTESSAPVRVGQVLAGKYRVERVIAVGGMGVVVEALHLDLDTRVALKFLRAEASDATGDNLERFLREGRAAAKLKSEHVARVMDVGRLAGGEPYMVMEFLQGRDLARVIETEGALPCDLAVSYILQACEAIAEAHAAGIVHRDLKPSNLFLTSRADGSPQVKVLDFGISKMAQPEGLAKKDITTTRELLGSPGYMSPEQVRSMKNVDTRTDIWALGLILYELLTGEPPFDAESLPALFAAIASDPPIPLRARRPDLSPHLDMIIMRCLSKEPSSRFPTVAELATALAPYATPEEQSLVARIVRMQSSAGLTRIEVTRLPALSLSGAAHSLPDTEATHFGIRPARSQRRPMVFIMLGVTGLVAIAGLTAWWSASERPQPLAPAPDISVSMPSRPTDLVAVVDPEPSPSHEVESVDAGDAGPIRDTVVKPTRTSAATPKPPSTAKAKRPLDLSERK